MKSRKSWGSDSEPPRINPAVCATECLTAKRSVTCVLRISD